VLVLIEEEPFGAAGVKLYLDPAEDEEDVGGDGDGGGTGSGPKGAKRTEDEEEVVIE